MKIEHEIFVTRAEPQHLARVIELMRELAEFEELLDEFLVTEELLVQYLFGEEAIAGLLIGLVGDRISGYAFYFHNFSTFRGRPGMYLEDLYVEPNARGCGLGKALLLEVARLAKSQGCPRFEWVVLDWNKSAQEFYESLGAKPLDGWTIYRMDQAALHNLFPD